MLEFLGKVFGLTSEPESAIDSVVKIEGNYFVIRVGAQSATGVSANEAREQVKKLGGNTKWVDDLERLP